MLYRSSDWHLGHERIIELCDRPFASLEEMHETIIGSCNEVVGPEDTLVLHGDTIMGDWKANLELLKRLRAGVLILLPGNHDKWSLAYKNKPEKAEAAREFVDLELRPAFREVVVVRDQVPSAWIHRGDGPVSRYATSHFPYTGDSHGKDRFTDLRPVDEGLALVCGHVHEAWRELDNMLNVGVDVWDFKPVPEDTVNDWLASLGPGVAYRR